MAGWRASTSTRRSVRGAAGGYSRREAQELEGALVLFFTGVSRYASDIAKEKIANLEKRSSQLRTWPRWWTKPSRS